MPTYHTVSGYHYTITPETDAGVTHWVVRFVEWTGAMTHSDVSEADAHHWVRLLLKDLCNFHIDQGLPFPTPRNDTGMVADDDGRLIPRWQAGTVTA